MEFMVTLGYDGDPVKGTTGWARNPAGTHAVGNVIQQAGTFMHELGHNLGLHHGGFDDTNCKPNYISVMSYSLQFPYKVPGRYLDYSHSALATLDENALDESAGIEVYTTSTGPDSPTSPAYILHRNIYGPPPTDTTYTGIPVDWNKNKINSNKDVKENINYLDTPDCNLLDLTELNGYNDWDHLIYNPIFFLIYIPPAASGRTYSNMSEIPSPSIAIKDQKLINYTPPEEMPPEYTFNMVRQDRILLLEQVHEAIKEIPDNSTFNMTQQSEGLKAKLLNETNPDTGSISVLLLSDQLDAAIARLTDLTQQLTSAGVANNNLLSKIDDLILSLKYQQ